MCTCVNEVVAAAHGGGFDVNSTVGCKKENISASRAQHGSSTKRHRMPARSGWSLIACVETLWSQTLPYSPASFPLFSNATVSSSLFLQPPSALIRLEPPGRFSTPETFVRHQASVTVTGLVLSAPAAPAATTDSVQSFRQRLLITELILEGVQSWGNKSQFRKGEGGGGKLARAIAF